MSGVVSIPVNILGWWAIGATIGLVLLIVLIMLVPRPVWRLFKIRWTNKLAAITCDDTGVCEIEAVERRPEGLYKKKGKHEITYQLATAEGEKSDEINKHRFILEGVWKPLYIIYKNKATAATPKQLQAILLDPREIKKQITLNINPATLIYTVRNAKAEGFMEAKGLSKQSIYYGIIILAFFIGAAFFYMMVIAPEHGTQQVTQVVQTITPAANNTIPG